MLFMHIEAIVESGSTKDIISTSQFAKWFHGSKVIDDNGKPLIVYHGTTGGFDQFKYSQDLGFHFGTLEQAEKIADNKAARFKSIGAGSSVFPVYLSIKNPVVAPDAYAWYLIKPALNALLAAGAITQGESQKILKMRVPEGEKLKAAQSLLKRKGYDGIQYDNETHEGSGTSYIAFDPHQIKSAIGNTGAFSSKKPSITESSEYTYDLTKIGPVVIDFGMRLMPGETTKLLHAVQSHQRTGQPNIKKLGIMASDFAKQIWKVMISKSITQNLYDKLGGRYLWNDTEVGRLVLQAMSATGGSMNKRAEDADDAAIDQDVKEEIIQAFIDRAMESPSIKARLDGIIDQVRHGKIDQAVTKAKAAMTMLNAELSQGDPDEDEASRFRDATGYQNLSKLAMIAAKRFVDQVVEGEEALEAQQKARRKHL